MSIKLVALIGAFLFSPGLFAMDENDGKNNPIDWWPILSCGGDVFTGIELEEKDFLAIVELLKRNPPISVCNLRVKTDENYMALKLADCLQTNSKIVDLRLTGREASARTTWHLRTPTFVGYRRINNEGAKEIAKLLSHKSCGLISLDLSQNEIGDQGIAVIAKALKMNTSLESLTLCSTTFGLTGVDALTKSLKKNNKIQKISIELNDALSSANSSFAKFFQRLNKKNNLKTLDLTIHVLREKEAAVIAPCLSLNSSLTSLKLWHNDNSTENAISLLTAFEHNKTIVSLSLFGMGAFGLSLKLHSKLLTSFGQLLSCSSLRCLNLGHCSFDAKTANIFFEALSKKINLEELIFSRPHSVSPVNQGSLELDIWLKGLRSNEGLTTLALDGWMLTSDFANNLLKQQVNLTKLNLSHCHIEWKENVFAEELKKNTVLTDLNIESNSYSFDREELNALAESLKSNNTLSVLNLAHIHFGLYFDKILAALRANKNLKSIKLGYETMIERYGEIEEGTPNTTCEEVIVAANTDAATIKMIFCHPQSPVFSPITLTFLCMNLPKELAMEVINASINSSFQLKYLNFNDNVLETLDPKDKARLYSVLLRNRTTWLKDCANCLLLLLLVESQKNSSLFDVDTNYF